MLDTVFRMMKTHGWACFHLFLSFWLTLILPAVAQAHRVYVYAWVEGGTVFTESYFSSKRKVQQGRIEVLDPDGNKLLEGRTDESGEFRFPLAEKTDLRIVVEAGMGHKGEYVLKAQEFSETMAPQAEPIKAPQPGLVNEGQPAIDVAQLQRAVEAALDKKLSPIIREFKRSRDDQGPRVRDVVAGIGYIFGTMGLILYFRGRKKD